jgi:hypothetical protein
MIIACKSTYFVLIFQIFLPFFFVTFYDFHINGAIAGANPYDRQEVIGALSGIS